MSEKLSPPRLNQDFFRERREQFFEQMGEDAIAIFEGPPQPSSSEGRFRQDSDLYYLTGFPEPSAVVVLLSTGGKRTYVLFVQPRDPFRERWDGSRVGVDGAVRDYGADAAHSLDELSAELPKLFAKVARVLLTPNIHSTTGRDIFEMFDRARRSGTFIGHGTVELVDPAHLLAQMRVRKTPEEIAMMRHAAAITREAYDRLLPTIQPGRWEYELEALLDYGFRTAGGDGPAYTTIVGSGTNATTLHYVLNERRIQDGDLVLIDAGASYGHYACDVTRTYPANGTFNGPQREVYELVLRTQKTAIDRIRPGVSLTDVHRAATLVLIEGMIELGWLESGDPAKLFEENAHRKVFMHSIGHFLGLDTHDAGPSRIEGKPYELEEGVVLTVEPGLYISEGTEGIDERYHGIGVRIEDDVLVTKDGCDVLTDGIPKQVDELEHAIGRR